MNKKTVIILISLYCYISFTTCRKEGCLDVNAFNYYPEANINDGFCSYCYVNAIIVNKIPLRDSVTYEEIIYDTINIDRAPDIKFYMKEANQACWEIETPIAINNKAYPYSWEIQVQLDKYLQWNETYKFLLSNENFLEKKTIFFGYFIPSLIYKNGKLLLINPDNTVEIELSFVVF